MEEKLIIAVGNHPVLYDQSLYTYLDTNRRDQAWKEVAETVGESEPEEDSQVREDSQSITQEAPSSIGDKAGSDAGGQNLTKLSNTLLVQYYQGGLIVANYAGRQTEQEETVEVTNKGRKRKRKDMSCFERELLAEIEPLMQGGDTSATKLRGFQRRTQLPT
ncbi:hypothetical protein DPX16_17849 [Anabarilius grahami]|uniref:MADF domain-containing protein n=1 Tax=Anabarilius grahami TaxID=495550 RepID=A0A3N0YHF8_ANAGA|nr:hypothetical protein DPX16_17849 [Anabarilius grahami]